MITVDGLTVEFGGTTLFKDISFQINEKDRIALMGKNGAGKSTLLKIIAGVRTATRGSVSAPKDCVIAYLPQHLMTEDGRTVFEETCQAFAHLHQIQAEIDRINNELMTRTDYDSDEYMQLIENVSTLSEKFYAIDMTHFEEDVEKTLLGLGFEREDFNRPTSEFSGGWRMRIELAKLLLKSPDVLLLDEPTNHLDIESIGWLEDFICNSSKAVVVISHDRKFVDDITTRTIEVTMGRIYDYKATYSQYLELRKERREQQMKQYEEQQKMIADTKEFIERFKGTYSKTLQVQSRVKMLEKLQLIEVDEEDTSRLRLKFPPSPRSGAYPVQMSDVAMSFDGKNVFSGVNLTVERGDKIAFVGRNGEGKSTLVKCIMGQLQNEGKLELGHNVQIGYFAQNQASLLDGELTVFQTIDDVAKGDVRNKIRDLLGAFMFGGEESTKKVKVLSGGERTRLAILKLLLEPVNLLILDEPTNHLDLKTKDGMKLDKKCTMLRATCAIPFAFPTIKEDGKPSGARKKPREAGKGLTQKQLVLFPITAERLKAGCQHFQRLADAPRLRRADRHAPHTADAELVVVVFWIVGRYCTCRALARADTAFRTVLVCHRKRSAAALLVRAVAWQCEMAERFAALHPLKNGSAKGCQLSGIGSVRPAGTVHTANAVLCVGGNGCYNQSILVGSVAVNGDNHTGGAV